MIRFIKYLSAAAIAFSVGTSCEVEAGIMSGEDLVAICEPSTADPLYRLKVSECIGYIVGVADSFDCRNQVLGFNWDSRKYSGQNALKAVVLDWLHFHPHVLNYQASGLVASALATGLPCDNSTASSQ